MEANCKNLSERLAHRPEVLHAGGGGNLSVRDHLLKDFVQDFQANRAKIKTFETAMGPSVLIVARFENGKWNGWIGTISDSGLMEEHALLVYLLGSPLLSSQVRAFFPAIFEEDWYDESTRSIG